MGGGKNPVPYLVVSRFEGACALSHNSRLFKGLSLFQWPRAVVG
jgi:hypothetical protein